MTVSTAENSTRLEAGMSGIAARHEDEQMDTSPTRNTLLGSLEEYSRLLEVLASQKFAEHTLHEIVYALRYVFKAHSVAVVIKCPRTGDLRIRSHANLPHMLVSRYRRPVGVDAIGRLLYSEPFVSAHPSGDEKDYRDLKLDEDYARAEASRIALLDRTLGYLIAYWVAPAPADDPARPKFIEGMARLCALALITEEHRHFEERLRIMDPESGLCLFPTFARRLSEEVHRSARHDLSLSVALMDVANFREITNTFGQETAATAFLELIDLVKNCLRHHDVACRFGSDEVMMFFPSTRARGAEQTLERIRDVVAEHAFTNQGFSLGLHIGYAEWDPEENVQELLLKTQKALHTARLSNSAIARIP